MEEVQEFYGENYTTLILKHYRKHNVHTIPAPSLSASRPRVLPSPLHLPVHTHLCLALHSCLCLPLRLTVIHPSVISLPTV